MVTREFTWLRRTISKDASTGQEKETFTDNGTLWGSITELNAAKRMAFGMLNSEASLELRFRQWPGLDANDRLQDGAFNDLIVIDGVLRIHQHNTTVVYAHILTDVTP